MEFVIVRFREKRPVLVDGQRSGETSFDTAYYDDPAHAGEQETVLRIEKGTHTFRLDPTDGAVPTEITVTVEDTSAIAPLEVHFD